MMKCNICGGKIIQATCESCGSKSQIEIDSEDNYYQTLKLIQDFSKNINLYKNQNEKINYIEKIFDKISNNEFNQQSEDKNIVSIISNILSSNDNSHENLFLAGSLFRNFMELDMNRRLSEANIDLDKEPILGKKRILKAYFNDQMCTDAIKLFNIWYYLNENIIHADFFSYKENELYDLKIKIQNYFEFYLDFLKQ